MPSVFVHHPLTVIMEHKVPSIKMITGAFVDNIEWDMMYLVD